MNAKVLLLPTLVLALSPVLPLRAQNRDPHGGLTLDCGECHVAERWAPVDRPPAFRHERTGFALENAHARVSCRGCHKSLVFDQLGTACVDCHRDPHRGELGARCDGCHSTRTWSNQREMIAVHNRTRFPLFAVHANVDCESCHGKQQPFEYQTTPTECGACHVATYDRTTNPSHAAAGFPRQCEGCHRVTSTSWTGANFRHDSFALRGGHLQVSCDSCHHGGQYRGTSRDCVGCHRPDYERSRDPNHVSSGFPTTCQSCHSESAWRPASGIDHNQTRFPLTGAHGAVPCARCHVGGRYAGTPTDCYSCHETNYRGAPNHAGFPHDCQSCHTTTAWKPANFDHNRTNFPLTGAHQRTACDRCHPTGRYAGTATDCYSCHRSNYDATSNPNHRSSSFPTQCESCHNTTAWRPASFDHDGRYFPIYSGKHRGRWSSCGDCHLSAGNYRAFECIFCHPHSDKAQTDSKHREVSGYRYESASCYRCHPRGVAGD